MAKYGVSCTVCFSKMVCSRSHGSPPCNCACSAALQPALGWIDLQNHLGLVIQLKWAGLLFSHMDAACAVLHASVTRACLRMAVPLSHVPTAAGKYCNWILCCLNVLLCWIHDRMQACMPVRCKHTVAWCSGLCGFAGWQALFTQNQQQACQKHWNPLESNNHAAQSAICGLCDVSLVNQRMQSKNRHETRRIPAA